MRFSASRWLASLLAFIAVVGPGDASAAKRVALIIGNSAYQYAGELTNPRNDAADMAAALRMHGFTIVEGLDLDKASMDRKIRDFAEALQGAAVGLLFYAGHGLQVAGANYLVPVDAQLTSAAALDFEMVRLDLVHRTMEREAQTNIIFLDACRDNPLARNLARAMGTRSTDVGRGLAAVESGVGTLISFSTQPGNVALDGAGRNSPFAGALVKHLSASKEDLSALLIAVRNDVMQETQRKQVPWEHSALTGRFYFGAAARPAPSSTTPAPSASPSEAAEAWDRIKDATNVAILETFIARYRGTFYADLASARIVELKKQQVAVAAQPPPAPSTASPVQRSNPKPPTGPPAKTVGQSAWVKLCENAQVPVKGSDGKEQKTNVKICLTHHERLDGNSGVVMVSAALRQIQGRDARTLMVMVPLGMMQSAGVRVKMYPQALWEKLQKKENVDDSQSYELRMNFALCHQAGCTAEIEASPDTVEWMNRAGGMIVYALNANGSPVAFPVPFNGFAAALAGDPVDNQKYAEARKKLLDQIKERQELKRKTDQKK
jgi:invasion protein IalB